MDLNEYVKTYFDEHGKYPDAREIFNAGIREGLKRQPEVNASAFEALKNIRQAGYNYGAWANWAQKTASWGMEPTKWPKQSDDAPVVPEPHRPLNLTKLKAHCFEDQNRGRRFFYECRDIERLLADDAIPFTSGG